MESVLYVMVKYWDKFKWKYVRSETISIEISSFSLVDAPLDFVRKLADVEVGELPGVAVLECELNKPDIPVKWFRDNKPLAPGKKYKMMDEGTVHKLEITDVDGEDEGNYYVVAGGLKSDANVFVEGMHIMVFCFYNLYLDISREESEEIIDVSLFDSS